MGAKRRKDRARREPVFDASPAAALDVRLDARDRPAGPPEAKTDGERRRRAASPDSSRPRRSEPAIERSPRRPRRGGGGGRKGRSRLTRLIYWSLVLGLWMLIAGIGAI